MNRKSRRPGTYRSVAGQKIGTCYLCLTPVVVLTEVATSAGTQMVCADCGRCFAA